MSDKNQYSKDKSLHVFWEFSPFIQGGLGVAGKALCDAISQYKPLDIICPETLSGKINDIHPYTVYQIKMLPNSPLSSTYTGSSDEFESSLKDQINIFSKGVKMAHFTGYKTIHAHDWITFEAAKIIQSANSLSHTPIILHIHSTQVDRVGEHTNGTIFNKEKLAMQHADEIITVSELTKRTMIDRYQISSHKINVVRNSTTRQLNTRSTQSKRPNHPPTILFVARLESQKSPLFALEVICATLRKIPKARGIIAGGGSNLSSIREVLKFKKMDSRIEVLGHIPHEKMHLVYEASDVLILPSASEPFGLVALEAAQSGLAVILSDRCGVAETLRCAPQLALNSTRSFDDWVNTSVNLLSVNHLRNQQISKQEAELSEYSWDDAAINLLSVLEI